MLPLELEQGINQVPDSVPPSPEEADNCQVALTLSVSVGISAWESLGDSALAGMTARDSGSGVIKGHQQPGTA